MEASKIDEQLAAALSETARLRSENERLRKLLRIRDSCPQVVLASEMHAKAPIAASFSSDEKVRLFRALFKGREDVYAVRWEGRNGKAGYSPACARRGFFASKVKAKANREFLRLTDFVVRGPPIHEVYKALTGDEPRNRLIVQDVLNAVGKDRPGSRQTANQEIQGWPC